MDHLAGKLFIDYLSPLKRQRIQRKLEKGKRISTDKPPGRKEAII
jgi:peptide deformylase